MSVRPEVRGELFSWARERSGIALEDLTRRFPRLSDWEAGDQRPTLKQIEGFAQATHTPVGYLFLPTPPNEQLPIPDYRTMTAVGVRGPSPDLLDTVFQCQQRQEWFRDFAQSNREARVSLVGAAGPHADPLTTATTLRSLLHFEVGDRGSTWSQAFFKLVDAAEDQGVLVMVNGVVGSNTHRKLNPREFRGFALIDDLAPLVFINGADTRAAQIFTLAHELAHVVLGVSALSDADVVNVPINDAERWCNQLAAEFLVPLESIHDSIDPSRSLTEELDRLAARFKVSSLVILRRLHDASYLDSKTYHDAFAAELERVLAFIQDNESSGGNFYNTQPVRVSKRFARAVITSTLEGRTLYRDAFHMLGFKKLSTFQELGHRLGVA